MKFKLVMCASLFLLVYSSVIHAGLLSAIGKGIGKLWDEATSSGSKHTPDGSSLYLKPEIPKKTFDEIIGNNAESYSIEPLSNNHFEIHWSYQASNEFRRTINKQCIKLETREKVENSVEEYRKLIAKIESKKGNVSDYVGAKIFVHVLNKKLIPSVGIDFISVDFDDALKVKDVNFELSSMCGYSIKYAAFSEKVTISGARIDGTQVLRTP